MTDRRSFIKAALAGIGVALTMPFPVKAIPLNRHKHHGSFNRIDNNLVCWMRSKGKNKVTFYIVWDNNKELVNYSSVYVYHLPDTVEWPDCRATAEDLARGREPVYIYDKYTGKAVGEIHKIKPSVDRRVVVTANFEEKS
jgi:hypothetical protein